jgi:hypothetical protein
MYREGQSPLHTRHIVRTKENKNAINAVSYLYDKWIHYTAEAFGLGVTYEEKDMDMNKSIDINTPFQGKIKYLHPEIN